MRCSIKTLKRILQESSRGETVVMHEKLWIPLIERMELYVAGQTVLYLPRKEYVDRLLQYIEAKVDQADKLRHEYDAVGQICLIVRRSPVIADRCDIRAHDGVEVLQSVRLYDLWIEVDASVDFRPDEPLPEDYYAL